MKFVWAVIGCFLFIGVANAQHPIDVQRKTAQGEHFEALKIYEKLPARIITTESRIAAAKAAWALSLPDRAIQEFDLALRSDDLSTEQRARLLLSRAVIEYQESREQVAILFLERAVSALTEPSPLRARIWSLWGECLFRIGNFGAAEQKYISALEEVELEYSYDIHFLLGQTQLKLGKLDEARTHLEQVPLNHENTARALRQLAALSLEEKKYSEAAFWLSRGREQFSDEFLDSWVDFALVQVAIHNKDHKRVQELQTLAQKRYPPSDVWLVLLNAAVEGFEWSRLNITKASEEESNGES